MRFLYSPPPGFDRSGSRISANPFVETTLSYALTYISHVARQQPSHSMTSTRLVVLADNDYYSQPSADADADADADTASPEQRFARFPTTLGDAHKTGLGSSAALVTALTAALLARYLPAALFDITSSAGRNTLHNLAQAAHCAAQGKVGSGFDIAAAVFGSCLYRRFSPAILARLPEPGAPGFGDSLVKLVDDPSQWDFEIQKEGVGVPAGLALRMCDVDCGSQTVGMVKKVLEWRGRDPDGSGEIWSSLQARNEHLGKILRDGHVDEVPSTIRAMRELIREMGGRSGVPIEPESQTELLDALSGLEGVYGGVVPGAGGYDAVTLLMKDDETTRESVETFLAAWSKEKGAKVRMLNVKGEMDGVRTEDWGAYRSWLPFEVT